MGIDCVNNQDAMDPFMISKQLKELEAARAEVAKLEQAIATERAKELASLPAQYGFETTAAFAKAVRKAASGKTRQGKRRPRVAITDAIRKKVQELAASGKTLAAIAKATGISSASVQNIKKSSGLTRAQKK